MEQPTFTSQTMELVCVRKKEPDRPKGVPPFGKHKPRSKRRLFRRAVRRGMVLVLAGFVLGGGGYGGFAEDFWNSREVASFLLARTTPVAGASVFDVLARAVSAQFATEFVPVSTFLPPASDGGATLFGEYLAYDRFPDMAANPLPPESDITRYPLPQPSGEGPIPYTIQPQSTAGYEYYQGIFVQNNTGTATNIASVFQSGLPFSLPESGPAVLILHTHTSEAFEPELWEEDSRTGDDRTANPKQSVVEVGRAIAAVLASQGISVLHDTTVYDETYNGAYARSLAGAERMLLRYPSIQVVLDIHRDALNEAGNRRYKLVFDHEGETAAQVMLLVGTDKGSLPHKDWEKNYAFALQVQAAMVEKNTLLPRPIKLTRSSYHQHIAQGALLVEVGANGNTTAEAVLGGRLFAESLAQVLLAKER